MPQRIEHVDAQGVWKTYGAVVALRGVNGRFEAGRVTVVQGANGAGKSTLLAVLGGVTRPSRGRVWVEGVGEMGEAARGLVGWVGHESLTYGGLTVRENVELAARTQGVEASEAWEEAEDRFALGSIATRETRCLSRGQRQRVALARGLVNRPALLLLDEPWTGLDAGGRRRLDEVIAEERSRGAIVVVVAHETEVASRLGGERLLLERGGVQAGAHAVTEGRPRTSDRKDGFGKSTT
ncbi:MAG: ATP-binding cassette domain-containing protein [Polyangiaceae bacterium]|nr:ATP-binding cassette domain-containing protein [Polyangiaceae bacterium]